MALTKQPFNIQMYGRLRMNAHQTQLGPNETYLAQNIDYDVPGARNKRKGYAKKYTDSLGAGGIKGMCTYDPRVGDTQELVFYSTKAYKEVSGALQEVLSGLTAGMVDSVQMNDQLFFLNGTDRKRYDGINFFPWGVAAPATAPSVAAGSSGSLSGKYYYKVVFVDSKGALSNPSPASASISITSKKVNLSSIPVGAAGTDVAKRQIFRTMANQTDYYYYVTVIEDNTTTTYTDDVLDTALGSKIETDNDVCPQGGFCETWNARVFVSGKSDAPQRVYPSKILRPEQFETSLEIEASDGQSVTGLLSFGNCLLIGKERGIYRLRGDVSTPSDVISGLKLFEIKGLKSHVGPCNHRVFCKFGAWAMFLSRYEGVWCLISPEDTEGIPNVIYAGEDIEPITKKITDFDSAFGYVSDNKYYLHIKTSDGNYCLICDFKRSNPLKEEFWWAVMKYSHEFTCLHRRTDGYLYADDAANGLVYKMGKPGDEIPYSDDGQAIDAYFYFPDTDFSFMFSDAGVRDKLMPKLWITAKRWSTENSIKMLPVYNGTPGKEVTVEVTEAIDAMGDMTRAGDMEYDTYRIDLSEQIDVVEPLFKHWGCKIQNNQLDQGMTIYKVGGEARFLPAR